MKKVQRQLRVVRDPDTREFSISYDPGDDAGDGLQLPFGAADRLAAMLCQMCNKSLETERILRWEERQC